MCPAESEFPRTSTQSMIFQDPDVKRAVCSRSGHSAVPAHLLFNSGYFKIPTLGMGWDGSLGLPLLPPTSLQFKLLQDSATKRGVKFNSRIGEAGTHLFNSGCWKIPTENVASHCGFGLPGLPGSSLQFRILQNPAQERGVTSKALRARAPVDFSFEDLRYSDIPACGRGKHLA